MTRLCAAFRPIDALQFIESADRRVVRAAVKVRGLGAASRVVYKSPDWDCCLFSQALIAELCVRAAVMARGLGAASRVV